MRHFLFSLTFFLISLPAFAQPVQVLGVGPSGIQAFSDSLLTAPVDSLAQDATVYYQVHVINASATSILDTTTADLVCITSLDSMERAIGSFLVGAPLQPGDSINPSPVGRDTASAARYGTGGGGVVVIIWPVARQPGFSVGDSGSIPINLLASTGIGKPFGQLPLRLRFGPNPAKEWLNIDYGQVENEIESVILSDNQGRALLQSDQAIGMLPLAAYPPGIYRLLVKARDGRAAVFTVIKYGE